MFSPFSILIVVRAKWGGTHSRSNCACGGSRVWAARDAVQLFALYSKRDATCKYLHPSLFARFHPSLRLWEADTHAKHSCIKPIAAWLKTQMQTMLCLQCTATPLLNYRMSSRESLWFWHKSSPLGRWCSCAQHPATLICVFVQRPENGKKLKDADERSLNGKAGAQTFFNPTTPSHKTKIDIKERPLTTSNQLLFPYYVALRLR